MALTDGTLYVHGTGTSAFGPISYSGGIYGDAICAAGSQYSNNELDFGAPGSASSYPYVSQFPSLTEKGYTNPPEVLSPGQIAWGLHLQIMSAFNTLTSVNFQVCSGPTANVTYNSTGNPIAQRALTLAQMQVVGAHYFIPVNPYQVLEFMRFYAAITGSNPTTGTLLAWFGMMQGGEI